MQLPGVGPKASSAMLHASAAISVQDRLISSRSPASQALERFRQEALQPESWSGNGCRQPSLPPCYSTDSFNDAILDNMHVQERVWSTIVP